MSVLKEINDLHISSKTIIISLSVILPFWYLSIILLKLSYVENNQIHIPIVLSVCLTLIYYTLNLLITVIYDILENQLKNKKINFDNDEFVTISVITCIVSILWMSLLLFIGYYFDWKLLSYIKIVFLVSILHIPLFFILHIIKLVKANKKK